ncbi:hypothetical protein LCGC14_1691870 [marine sediment metagenome]|uniref:Uncharacterized protein n=1 Tax=marine sediment metagenome TaxID=412755 RepID=A0A0F9HKH6_9ZZZZ
MDALTEEQAQTIIMNALAACHPETISKTDLENIIGWAQNVIIDYGTLTNVLKGNILVVWKDEETQFRLSPKGKKLAKDIRNETNN